jgi:curved DNA-binding protein CbpA
MSHYDTLGVPRNATAGEIKAAYRKLSKETHPDATRAANTDANEGRSSSGSGRTIVDRNARAERFKRVSVAASVLTNPRRRAAYDAELAASGPFGHGLHRSGRSPHGGGDGTSSFWNRPVGGGFGSSSSSAHRTTSGLPLFFHNLLRPRTFVLGTAAVVLASAAFRSLPRDDKKGEGSDLVQAWKNPRTGGYEQPAPWDPLYRSLDPPLELVPREQVKRRHR